VAPGEEVRMGDPKAIGASGAGSPARTPWCPGGNLTEPVEIPLAAPSSVESSSISPEQDPAF